MDKVDTRLRQSAQRASRSGDLQVMRGVAKAIVTDLFRQGQLLRVEAEGKKGKGALYGQVKDTSRVLDLSAVGLEFSSPPKPVSKNSKPSLPSSHKKEHLVSGSYNLDNMLEAMKVAPVSRPPRPW